MNTFTASNKTEWSAALSRGREGDIIEALNNFESYPADGGFIKKGKYRISAVFFGSFKDSKTNGTRKDE